MSFGIVPFLNQLSFYKDRDFLTFVADMTDITLTIGGCFMCLFITYRWKIYNMNKELSEGNPGYMNSFARRYINFTIVYVCPALLGILSILIIIDKFWGLSALWNL
jgi:NSS family neurotransmitter:Na+ symporter